VKRCEKEIDNKDYHIGALYILWGLPCILGSKFWIYDLPKMFNRPLKWGEDAHFCNDYI